MYTGTPSQSRTAKSTERFIAAHLIITAGKAGAEAGDENHGHHDDEGQQRACGCVSDSQSVNRVVVVTVRRQ
jgi:hypothetical protein